VASTVYNAAAWSEVLNTKEDQEKMNKSPPADPGPGSSIYDDEPLKPGREFVLPKEPRRRYTIWIDGRIQTKFVTAKSEKVAVEIVYQKWGVERTYQVVAKPKFPVDYVGRDTSLDDQPGPLSTPADGLAFKMGRVLAGWTTRVAERRAGLKTLQRMYLEEGRATAGVKAAAFRALKECGVPIEALVQIASEFLERQHSAGKNKPKDDV
jgi:hypothetical protein